VSDELGGGGMMNPVALQVANWATEAAVHVSSGAT